MAAYRASLVVSISLNLTLGRHDQSGTGFAWGRAHDYKEGRKGSVGAGGARLLTGGTFAWLTVARSNLAAKSTRAPTDIWIKLGAGSDLESVRMPLGLPSRGNMRRKHLSRFATHLLQRCAEELDAALDPLVDELDVSLKPGVDNYSRMLVEYCCSKVLEKLCGCIGEKIADACFSRFTFDMMLAWESPSSADEESRSDNIAKEKEDRKNALQVGDEAHDEIPLFYSEIMPLLVDEEKNVGEDAFAWLASLLPLVADIVNARFAFEALTATTAKRLHFPAYDRFLKEIDKCIRYLRKQAPPTGFELAEDEFILHVDGTARTQRVVRHIGGASWPGRLTLTNLALYFEASGVISYEPALKLRLRNPDVDHRVKAASTGPWGAPLFDRAITYESSELSEAVVLEFPEMTSSTRRDLWLSLIKEVILVHRFVNEWKIDSPLQAWEMQARTILGVFRLHAAREMQRISPPVPNSFLIFSLFDELHRGDYVLEELRNSLKRMDCLHPRCAASILKGLNMDHRVVSTAHGFGEQPSSHDDAFSSLDSTVSQVKEEAKEVGIAKASVEGLRGEGIADSLLLLAELASPLKDALPWFQEVLACKRPAITASMFAVTMLVIYKEWVGSAMATSLMGLVGMMFRARHGGRGDKRREILVSSTSDKTTIESIVAAQRGLKTVQEVVKTANITILKARSILEFRAPKHAYRVIWVMAGLSAILLLVPFKFILMGITMACFFSSCKAGKSMSSLQGSRRLREWWESIPVVPVRTAD